MNSMNLLPPYLSLTLLECCHFSQPVTPMTSDDLSSCVFCSFESKISNYQSLLICDPEECDHGIEAVPMKSLTERSLNLIYKFATKNGLHASILEDGKLNIELFCDLKNEIQNFRQWFIKIKEHAMTLDALLQDTKPIKVNATTTSIQVQKSTVGPPSRLRSVNTLEPVQIKPRIQLEVSALDQSSQNLNDCLRDLEYIKGLQRYGYGSDSSVVEVNPKKCTVEHSSQKWVFLPCNHFFCANCCSGIVSCLICSKKFPKQVIRFIDMQSGSKHTVTNIPSLKITNEKIWRNPFTKVEGVIRTLLTIQKSYPCDKALVICTYDAMLQVFAAEFVQNSISFVLYKRQTSKVNRNTLLQYRTDSTQVLLMPLVVASTGLNLTEANHILLVEPCLHLAMEDQAIGRIHRLGQKKPTYVHRFYVANTIEEKLVRMDKDKKMSNFVEGNTTIQDVLDLFDDNTSSRRGIQK